MSEYGTPEYFATQWSKWMRSCRFWNSQIQYWRIRYKETLEDRVLDLLLECKSDLRRSQEQVKHFAPLF